MNERKVAAERELARTNEELRLWKFQFDHAQREITRAQGVVQLVERQRDDAERAAAAARTSARKLNEQRLVSDAMEEGRQLGFQAGFRRAKQEMAYSQGADAYHDLEREIEDARLEDRQEDDGRESGPEGSPAQPLRDINASPVPAPRSPQVIRMPEVPVPSAQPPAPSMSVPSPAVAMPSPVPASARAFQTESVRRGPASARSPSILLDRYPIEIPTPSVLNREQYPQQSRSQSTSAPQRPPPQEQPHYDSDYSQLRRSPSISAQHRSPRPLTQEQLQYDSEYAQPRRSPSVGRSTRPLTQGQPQYQTLTPDNYIPSVSAEGGIALPPPFQLSQPVLPTAAPARTQSWYNRERVEEPAQQSWYQPKRPRSNAGSATGRSNAGSVTGRSATSRHSRHASLESSRVSHKNVAKLAGEYGSDLGAIREDTRPRPYAYAAPERRWDEAPQRAKSMGESAESLPPPLPEKDARHQKQVIADELRWSNPKLPESWRRDGVANAESGSSKSRLPRNVRVPANLTFPAPLSPQTGPVPLGHMRARTMSGSTGRSGWSQPPNMVDVANRPSLRRVKERRPISPSDVGSPFSGTINVEPPSQSSSQIPFHMSTTPSIDQYLDPNYQQPLPRSQESNLPSGFVPQTVTVPAEVTVPVTYKGKQISSPIVFPSGGPSVDPSYARPRSGLGNYPTSPFSGSTTSVNRGRSASAHNPARATEQQPPLARPLSALSNFSRKSGKGELAPGPSLAHQRSTTSLRSTGSYARFDASSYVDPAYFAADTNPQPVPVPAPRSRRGSVSSHSGLSYMGPPMP
ncbi:hypothetical protein B0H10DRAFT_1067425 [Mycena sp. CBHHK59/15]|nr:hypothetical protein B0H10DRAFT_1067425 [Mycena sp. CBHHK59/15]